MKFLVAHCISEFRTKQIKVRFVLIQQVKNEFSSDKANPLGKHRFAR